MEALQTAVRIAAELEAALRSANWRGTRLFGVGEEGRGMSVRVHFSPNGLALLFQHEEKDALICLQDGHLIHMRAPETLTRLLRYLADELPSTAEDVFGLSGGKTEAHLAEAANAMEDYDRLYQWFGDAEYRQKRDAYARLLKNAERNPPEKN